MTSLNVGKHKCDEQTKWLAVNNHNNFASDFSFLTTLVILRSTSQQLTSLSLSASSLDDVDEVTSAALFSAGSPGAGNAACAGGAMTAPPAFPIPNAFT